MWSQFLHVEHNSTALFAWFDSVGTLMRKKEGTSFPLLYGNFL